MTRRRVAKQVPKKHPCVIGIGAAPLTCSRAAMSPAPIPSEACATTPRKPLEHDKHRRSVVTPDAVHGPCELVAVGPGYHQLAFEYRSVDSLDALQPTNSFATLSWTGFDATLALGSPDPVFADVGWFACPNTVHQIQGATIKVGFAGAGADLVAAVHFHGSFTVAPLIFVGYGSVDSFHGGHLRLVEANESAATVVVEFESCAAAPEIGDRHVGWLAIATGTEIDAQIHYQPTRHSDVEALLAMAVALRLPGYLRWKTGSDPCRDGWVGIECRTDAGRAPRVVILDLHSVDLTGNDVPWVAIGQLSSLEELSLWDTGLGGPVSASALCGLAVLRVLVLSRNMVRGTLPQCMVGLRLEWLVSAVTFCRCMISSLSHC